VWLEWRRGEICEGFWWRNLCERDYLEKLGVDGRIILKWIFKKYDGSLYCVGLAQNRHKWWAV